MAATACSRLQLIWKQFPKWVCKPYHVRNANSCSSKYITNLKDRNLIKAIHPEGGMEDLKKHLESTCGGVYCGFDPTADSLHIGNLISVVVMIHFQRAGYDPIAVLGGATAQIGDPSGKTAERPAMSQKNIDHNAECIETCLRAIFRNHKNLIWKNKDKLPDLTVLNNNEWYDGANLIKFLSTIGRKFRIGTMLSKQSVQIRLESEEGMSFTEFSYQLFQAYDWLQLFKRHKCTIQIGGNDQLGNIKMGHELIRKIENVYVYGIVVPLLTDADGRKLGKSTGNSVWLSPKKTSPYEFYQYFVNLPDLEVEQFLNLFSFLSDEELSDIMKEHSACPGKRIAQNKLAEQVTLLVHGSIGLEQAKKWTGAFFGGDLQAMANLTKAEIKELFRFSKNVEIIYEPGITIVDTIMAAKCFQRTVDAERTIREGGVSMNHLKVKDPHALPIKGLHILRNDLTLLRVGKKNYIVIRWIK